MEWKDWIMAALVFQATVKWILIAYAVHGTWKLKRRVKRKKAEAKELRERHAATYQTD